MERWNQRLSYLDRACVALIRIHILASNKPSDHIEISKNKLTSTFLNFQTEKKDLVDVHINSTSLEMK